MFIIGKDYASYPRVCCIHKVECSGVAPFSKDVVYFTSPSVPSSSPCSLTLALNPGVCQVRLDFLDFNVGSLQSGQCSPDASIQISTNVKDSFIPVSNLCGTLSTKVKEVVLLSYCIIFFSGKYGGTRPPVSPHWTRF